MTLEHYPGMTEQELARVEAEANARWPLQASLIVHRVGTLKPGDNIVLVVTASAHREAAFDAAAFLMDYLKTRAPFWKKEVGRPTEANGLDVRECDRTADKRRSAHVGACPGNEMPDKPDDCPDDAKSSLRSAGSPACPWPPAPGSRTRRSRRSRSGSGW